MPADTSPPSSGLIGRAAELELVVGGLRRSKLVTLWGAPGVGKTRLGLAATARLAHEESFVCEIVQVSLGHALDATGFRVALGEAVGMAPAEEAGLESIAEALERRGPIVVLLDAFEGLIESCRSSLTSLLELATTTRWLVTSRERVGLPEETIVPVEPLASEAAVELFLERAGLSATAELAPLAVVEELVKRLDCLPLAVELCAARAGALSPAQMLSELERRFSLLAPVPAAAKSSRALDEAIGSSWSALCPGERTVLAECSVFAGSFSAPSACATSSLDDASVLTSIDLLVRRALVGRSQAGQEGEPRFSLLESIRAYASERLVEQGTQAETLLRHARHYTRLGIILAERAWRSDTLPVCRRLELERANLLAVFERVVQPSPPDGFSRSLAVQAALSLGPLFYATGPYREALRLLQVASKGARLPDSLAHAVEGQTGIFLRLLGRSDEARVALQRAASYADAIERPTLGAFWRVQLAWVDVLRGDAGTARELATEAVGIFRSHRERTSEGRALRTLGHAHFSADDLAAARACYRQALGIHREVGDRGFEGDTLTALGLVELECGELSAARDHLEDALALGAEIGVTRWNCDALGTLALVEQESGALAVALERLAEALASASEMGRWMGESRFRGYLGGCLLEAGAVEEARRELSRALDARVTYGADAMGALFRALLGVARATLGDIAGATLDLDNASAEIAELPDERFLANAIAVHRGHLHLAQAPGVAEDGGGGSAALERAKAAALPSDATDFQQFDVRFARRLLGRALAGKLVSRPAVPWLIQVDGAWLSAPHRPRVELGRKRPLRRLLVALAKGRLSRPGSALTPSELVVATWPGERILPSAALNRLRVALHALRRLGLAESLVTHPDGYLLDPMLPLELREA